MPRVEGDAFMIANLIDDIGAGLHTIFIANFDMVVLIGLLGTADVHRPLSGAVDRQRARGRSVIPISFWFFSLRRAASFCSVMRSTGRDPVFILGQARGHLHLHAQPDADRARAGDRERESGYRRLR